MSCINLKQNIWDLDVVFPANHIISQPYFDNAPVAILENFKVLLSRDVFSEGDSQPFYDYLMTRKAEFSQDFLAFLDLWLIDELKHYEALRRVYSALSGITFREMDIIFSQRNHEIEPIAIALEDEFTILVTFMFDELSSAYSYRRDLQEYYSHFGSKPQTLVHHLIKDEGMHFNNAAQILLNNHLERLGEVGDFLALISKLESSLNKYYQTFFLDHAQEKYRFPTYFNSVIIRFILAHLGLGKKPKQEELLELWQWKPEGYNFVPVIKLQEEN